MFIVNHDLVIYNFRKELVERLINQSHDVVIVSPYGPKIEPLKKLGAEFESFSLNRHGMNPLTEIKTMRALKKIIKKNLPDVILTYTIKPNIYGNNIARQLKIPVISNITGLGSMYSSHAVSRFIYKLAYKLSMRKTSTIFVQNHSDLTRLQSIFKGSKVIKLLPGSGVNLDEFSYHERTFHSTIHFGFAGRIMTAKGIKEYLELASELINTRDDVFFHLAGFMEEDYSSLIYNLSKNPRFQYHGYLHNLKDYYETIHCLIHPSQYNEGLSNVLLEAAASGCALITRDRPGLKEAINHNGYTYSEDDCEGLIQTVNKYINLSSEEKDNMSKASRNHAMKFDRNIVINHYLTAIREAM